MSEADVAAGVVRAKLSEEITVASWSALEPHFTRGGLLLCADRVDLVDAATAIAQDDTARVSDWVKAGALGPPTQPQADAWSETGAVFSFLIVQPFVLAKLGVSPPTP